MVTCDPGAPHLKRLFRTYFLKLCPSCTKATIRSQNGLSNPTDLSHDRHVIAATRMKTQCQLLPILLDSIPILSTYRQCSADNRGARHWSRCPNAVNLLKIHFLHLLWLNCSDGWLSLPLAAEQSGEVRKLVVRFIVRWCRSLPPYIWFGSFLQLGVVGQRGCCTGPIVLFSLSDSVPNSLFCRPPRHRQ